MNLFNDDRVRRRACKKILKVKQGKTPFVND